MISFCGEATEISMEFMESQKCCISGMESNQQCYYHIHRIKIQSIIRCILLSRILKCEGKKSNLNLMKYSINMITYYLELSCLKGKGNEKAYGVFFFF